MRTGKEGVSVVEVSSVSKRRGVLTSMAVAVILVMLFALTSSCTERPSLQAGDPSTPTAKTGGSKQATPSTIART